MRWLVLLYPLAELWSLIELGSRTTASAALLWVLGSGFLGVFAIRFAGTQVLGRLQAAQREGVLQQHLVAGDMAMAGAGLLLIIPGLVSDVLAVLLLIRPCRSVLVRFLGSRVAGNYWDFTHTHNSESGLHRDTPSHAPFGGAEGVTLDGEYRELDIQGELLERPEADQKGPH